MKRLFLALAVTALVGGTAHAGLDVDFGAAIRIGDDADLYLSVSSRYFDQDRATVNQVAAHYNNSDDLAVAFFIARRSGKSEASIHDLRRRGMSWWDISVRVGVPVDAWFVAVDRDPGPPYGKAYGHYKHHKQDRHHAVVLTDADLRNLVAVRMLHEYYGVPVSVAMDWRTSGRDIRVLVAEEYHRRHKNPARADNRHPSNSQGHGSGKSKDK